MTERYLHRDCPSCGTAGGVPEMRSAAPAETLGIEALRPLWAGLHKRRVFFTYVRCDECGLLFCPRYFTPAQLASLYADLAPNMAMIPSAAVVATQLGYWRAVAGRVAPGGYLELGPDVGHIVAPAVASARFDRFWLFEPNRAVHAPLVAATAEVPAVIEAAMDDLSAVPPRSISLAVMIHVLDHIVDPLATLRQVRETLAADGLLLIVTHNEKSLLRAALGRAFPPFCLQHPELYSPTSIAGLLRRAGFAEAEVRRSVNHFPMSFLVRQAGRAAGVDLTRLPLPDIALGLKLGNMLTLARR